MMRFERGGISRATALREIVTGSRRMFTERGEYDLKGVPGRWRVHTLVRETASVAQGRR
jgi:hypothetical protein